jgi:hypothetical protein
MNFFMGSSSGTRYASGTDFMLGLCVVVNLDLVPEALFHHTVLCLVPLEGRQKDQPFIARIQEGGNVQKHVDLTYFFVSFCLVLHRTSLAILIFFKSFSLMLLCIIFQSM